jgi:hypothetical protein
MKSRTFAGSAVMPACNKEKEKHPSNKRRRSLWIYLLDSLYNNCVLRFGLSNDGRGWWELGRIGEWLSDGWVEEETVTNTSAVFYDWLSTWEHLLSHHTRRFDRLRFLFKCSYSYPFHGQFFIVKTFARMSVIKLWGGVLEKYVVYDF